MEGDGSCGNCLFRGYFFIFIVNLLMCFMVLGILIGEDVLY